VYESCIVLEVNVLCKTLLKNPPFVVITLLYRKAMPTCKVLRAKMLPTIVVPTSALLVDHRAITIFIIKLQGDHYIVKLQNFATVLQYQYLEKNFGYIFCPLSRKF
jgi:hypothetical protein